MYGGNKTDKQIADIINLERPPHGGHATCRPMFHKRTIGLKSTTQPNPTRRDKFCFNKNIMVQLKHAPIYNCVFPSDFV